MEVEYRVGSDPAICNGAPITRVTRGIVIIGYEVLNLLGVAGYGSYECSSNNGVVAASAYTYLSHERNASRRRLTRGESIKLHYVLRCDVESR